jgi:uncharacterized protein YndB with AHSA1/START domain
MTTRSAVHGMFTLTSDLAAPPVTVYAAFADPAFRDRWFRIPGPSAGHSYDLDFREGGGETASNSFPVEDGVEVVGYRSHFFDLVPDTRVVYAYEAVVDGLRRWVSLATVEFEPSAAGTRMSWTEQYAFLEVTGDGSGDVAHLRGGTQLRINGLSHLVRTLVEEGVGK